MKRIRKPVTGCIFFLFLVFDTPLFAQESVKFLVAFPSGRRDTIIVNYDPASGSGRTDSYPGDLPGRFDLSLTPPDENLYSSSEFSRFVRADDLFDVLSYPARAIVKLGTCRVNPLDTTKNKCTGTLVGDRFVLTSAHCVAGFSGINGESFIKTGLEISVAPSNGYCNPDVITTEVIRTYVIKDYVDPANFQSSLYPRYLEINDMALLELLEPIGRLTGWMGIGFNSDPAYYLDKVLHKFAIPGSGFGVHSPGNPSLIYNGDTLYYNYGLLGNADPMLEINGYVDDGAPGQSGSPFFYTDNDAVYEIYGTQTFYSKMGHVRLRDKFFYGFKYIMETWANEVVVGVEENPPKIECYPNPFTDNLQINLDESPLPVKVRLFSMNGSEIESTWIHEQRSTINLDHLPLGIYFLNIQVRQKPVIIKLVKK